ncbi:MAG TPA: esterase-like activity of phytase family protein [Flavisolibacter sp.]|nr:esterase-like activity of phytase family protein [Flavisolibacter sp.]
MKYAFSAFLLVFLSGCATQRKVVIDNKTQLKYLGEYSIPLKAQFNGTTVGGLSGIDYDAKNDVYYIISDDGSKIDPARVYKAKIRLSNKGIDTVQFLSVTTLLNQLQTPFLPDAIDPEAIRYFPPTDQIVWSSEGKRTRQNNEWTLRDPSVFFSNQNGKWVDSFLLPANLHMSALEKGPRNNGSFEGISFDKNYRSLFVNVEEPLFEDGHQASTGDTSAWTRIIQFDVSTRKPVAQYAYKVDPVAYPAQPSGAFKINGVSEIFWVAENKLLTIERSFSSGRAGCVIKLYLVDFRHATDVSSIASINTAKNIRPAAKKILLNMEDLGIPIYNIEGVTWGPVLPNGHATLLFVADDNFSLVDKTQFLFFEIK